MRRSPRWRQEQTLLRTMERAQPSHRPSPLTVCFRWRYEAILTAATAAGGFELVHSLGAVTSGPIVLLASAGVGSAPPLRRLVAKAFWHIATPHRIRRGLQEAGICTRSGRLPAVLLTRSVILGERVVLWLPAGTSPEDLHESGPLLRSACWAQDVRISRHHRYAHLVRVEVIRWGMPGQTGTAGPEDPAPSGEVPLSPPEPGAPAPEGELGFPNPRRPHPTEGAPTVWRPVARHNHERGEWR